MYYMDAAGKRVYTLKKDAGGKATTSAHPARFSPDDKFSRQRVTLKKRCVCVLGSATLPRPFPPPSGCSTTLPPPPVSAALHRPF